MKPLLIILMLCIALFSRAQSKVDTLKSFEAPISFIISPDTISEGVVLGRIVSATDMLMSWKQKTVTVVWEVRYYDLKSNADLTSIIPSYTISQLTDKNMFINLFTGENVALSEIDFLKKYGIYDSTDHTYKRDDEGNWLYIDNSTKLSDRIINGWSGYMFYSTMPLPLRELILQSGQRMFLEGRMNRPK